ncbi:MAG TPA: tetratricopeptide repeat protein [Elusimicrobiales bacterium]|nr:tetratricopeptide repeat protein [Elusimicrobiales bacterium]
MTLKQLAFALLLPAASAFAQTPPDPEQLKRYYDKAFEYYVAGDLVKSIENWNLVLRLDPDQVTAKNMIGEARRRMGEIWEKEKKAYARQLAAGRWSDALLTVEKLLATDPKNPLFLRLQERLRDILLTVRDKPSSNRAWNAAALGLVYYAGEEEDHPFAYDALRYAAELAPSDKRLTALVAAMEKLHPDYKLRDTRLPGVPILDHKRETALQYIYDAKFNLAIRELEYILMLEPEDALSLKRLGSTYLQLKDYRKARRAWQQALKASPGDEQLKEYLAALDEVEKVSTARGAARN